jgi:hypothetical protein
VAQQTFGARHSTIPPATPRFNGSVENFHGRIEDEFYDLEDLPTLPDFLAKAFTYMLYFNLERPNMDLKRTPFQMVEQKTNIKDPHFMSFPPLILDDLPLFAPHLLSVNDVSDEVICARLGGRRTGKLTTGEGVNEGLPRRGARNDSRTQAGLKSGGPCTEDG